MEIGCVVTTPNIVLVVLTVLFQTSFRCYLQNQCASVFIFRYKPPPSGSPSDDPTPDYMNLLGMIFSMCGLMLKVC